uniref:Uncharacterized protein n=1 Tax=Arundo donax TaxID=35708 RepID=A0A0A9CVP7_ARUDO
MLVSKQSAFHIRMFVIILVRNIACLSLFKSSSKPISFATSTLKPFWYSSSIETSVTIAKQYVRP